MRGRPRLIVELGEGHEADPVVELEGPVPQAIWVGCGQVCVNRAQQLEVALYLAGPELVADHHPHVCTCRSPAAARHHVTFHETVCLSQGMLSSQCRILVMTTRRYEQRLRAESAE